MDERPILETTVGRSVEDEHFYRGFATLRELLGREDYWSLVSLAVDGPRLTASDCRIVDAIAVSLLVPEPRLWLFKPGRLAASFGDALGGLAVGQMVMRGAIVGSHVTDKSVAFQQSVAEMVGEGFDDREAMDAVVSELLEQGTFLHGFGVPGRERDERAIWLERWYESEGRPGAREWRLYRNLCRAIEDAKGLTPNLTGTFTPIWLELGFTPVQAKYLTNCCVVINTLCNAFDGEQQKLEDYRRLPDSVIDYVGPPSRRSPRAIEEDG